MKNKARLARTLLLAFVGAVAQPAYTVAQTPVRPTVVDAPRFPDSVGHVGMYTPNAELLGWCVSGKGDDLRLCDTYIAAVAEASGMIDADFPKGPVDLSRLGIPAFVLESRKIVVAYLQALPPTMLSDPASRSVYQSLVARSPYDGPHKNEIPFRPKAPAGSMPGGQRN